MPKQIELKKHMNLRGNVMFGYSKIDQGYPFFRMVTINPDNTEADMDYLLNELIECAKCAGYE